MKNCTVYLVRFPAETLPLDQGPIAFTCNAANDQEAEQQAEAAYPGCDVISIRCSNALDGAW